MKVKHNIARIEFMMSLYKMTVDETTCHLTMSKCYSITLNLNCMLVKLF